MVGGPPSAKAADAFAGEDALRDVLRSLRLEYFEKALQRDGMREQEDLTHI
eukprot:gene24492-42965_t